MIKAPSKKQVQTFKKNRAAKKRLNSSSGLATARRRQIRSQQQSSNKMVVNVPAHTSHYVNSLCSPKEFPGCGVPSLNPIPTLKTSAFCRGILKTGTTVGFIYCNPNSGALNDYPSISYSDSAYAGSSFAQTGTGTVPAFTNAQFATSAIGSTPTTAKWRIVSGDLRVRYVGKELDRGGSYMALQHPDHLSLTGFDATATMAFDKAKKFPVNREWVSVKYCPLQDAFFGVTQADGSGEVGNKYMGILIENSVTGSPYEFEFWGNYEFEGQNIRGKTNCFVDVVGVNIAKTVMNSMPSVSSGNSDEPFRKTMWQQFKDLALKSVTWVGAELKQVASKAVPIVAEAAIASLAAI